MVPDDCRALAPHNRCTGSADTEPFGPRGCCSGPSYGDQLVVQGGALPARGRFHLDLTLIELPRNEVTHRLPGTRHHPAAQRRNRPAVWINEKELFLHAQQRSEGAARRPRSGARSAAHRPSGPCRLSATVPGRRPRGGPGEGPGRAAPPTRALARCGPAARRTSGGTGTLDDIHRHGASLLRLLLSTPYPARARLQEPEAARPADPQVVPVTCSTPLNGGPHGERRNDDAPDTLLPLMYQPRSSGRRPSARPCAARHLGEPACSPRWRGRSFGRGVERRTWRPEVASAPERRVRPACSNRRRDQERRENRWSPCPNIVPDRAASLPPLHDRVP